MTKPPPVTQEDAGAGDLDSEEEEFDKDDDNDDGLERRSVVHEWADSGRPKEGLIDAAREEATRASIPDRPRGTTRDGGKDDRANDDDDAARDEARRRPLGPCATTVRKIEPSAAASGSPRRPAISTTTTRISTRTLPDELVRRSLGYPQEATHLRTS